jgi:hypothetical protein
LSTRGVSGPPVRYCGAGICRQVVGALAILVAFVAAQLRFFDVRSWTYLWLNFAGALVLGIVAWHERLYGFLLLEVVWTLVSAWGLATRARGAQA